MSWFTERALPYVREQVEERVGLTAVPRERLTLLEDTAEQFAQFRDEASELAYWTMDYFGGRPQEMRPEIRARLAQRSRIALERDPLAGAEADLLTNFSFGKGVSVPDAEDEEVQKVIEDSWSDSVNEQKLTGFEAQRHRSFQLITQANLFPAAFVRNGKVRLGFLNADRIRDIICDSQDDERPLWYVYDEPPQQEYNYEEDRWMLRGEGSKGDLGPGGGKQNLRYYPHWRNVEDVRREREENNEEPEPEPPENKRGEGLVYHVRINRIGHTQFGTPPWARTLRFYSAMNSLTEAHVAMAQAASSFIAKRVLKGGPERVTRAANAILTQTGELGAARFGEGDVDETNAIAAAGLRGAAPPGPASLWLENEEHRLEALSLNSGSAQAQQTAQIVRAPIAAASQFGQHYLGDASNANLATATSLELPAAMTIQAWQQTHREMIMWYVDLVIQEAVRAGRLGGDGARPSIDRTLAELCLREAEEKEEAERRTGKKLGYEFSMPYPGRRNLPDVTGVVNLLQVVDPDGTNVPMRRKFLHFFAQHGLMVEDPSGWVDEVLPEEAGDAIAKMQLYQQIAGALNAQQSSAAVTGEDGPAGPTAPPGGDPLQRDPRGELPKNVRGGSMMEGVVQLLNEAFEEEVLEPLLKELGLAKNGHGG